MFSKLLQESEQELMERITPMSRRQRSSVSGLSRSGWEVDDRVDGAVLMKKGDSSIRVTHDGQVVALKESIELDITEIADIIAESEEFPEIVLEGDLLAEAVANANAVLAQHAEDSTEGKIAKAPNPLRALETILQIKHGMTGAYVTAAASIMLIALGIIPPVAALPIIGMGVYAGQAIGRRRAPAVAEKAVREVNQVLDELEANVKLRDGYFAQAKRIREETVGMDDYLSSYASQVKRASEKQAAIGIKLRDVLAKHGTSLVAASVFSVEEMDDLDSLSKAAQRGLVSEVAGTQPMTSRRAKFLR